MSRLSVRLRVVVASTVAMAVVLVALGAFLRGQVAGGLDDALGRTLDARLADVTGSLAAGRSARAAVPAGEADEDTVVVQVLDRSGRVLAASPGLAGSPLLRAGELREAADDDVTIDRRDVGVRDDDGDTDAFAARLRATPVDDDRADLPIVVAATGVADRDAAVRSLDTALAIGLPVAILLSAALGWALARGALRPVEAMRRRADGIAGPSDERLPVPRSRDEIARLGRTLNAMLDRQAAGFRRERAFAADASHELRTPLTVLRTELDLATRGERDAGELRAALASASDETRRLERLADDLLVLSRAESGRPDPPAEVPVRHLLEAVRDRFSGAFAAEDRSLEVVLDVADPRVVTGRSGDLDRALSGLVVNALHHGGGETELRVAASGDGRVAFHVLDRGPGVPTDLRGRVFDRFVTGAGDRRERRGTGLGLAIVAAVAASHGGRADVEDRTGGGTDAWFSVAG
ncbi:sensor histidine kinase [Patulibacter minatonensis]|uniref:sensor histidine kinase n=1 Tax=Patulibacter minatonensis TaxID=298163 RepID=UPI0006845D6C|nr:HAMP domain-containing sensor histidine kinase [Patulibacter minatonensis]